jgi:hypothetical protein
LCSASPDADIEDNRFGSGQRRRVCRNRVDCKMFQVRVSNQPSSDFAAVEGRAQALMLSRIEPSHEGFRVC